MCRRTSTELLAAPSPIASSLSSGNDRPLLLLLLSRRRRPAVVAVVVVATGTAQALSGGSPGANVIKIWKPLFHKKLVRFE